jgi:N6-L-threonylcarbamoyladenine synthase
MIVLGIETSCDETAVALYGDEGLLAHEVYSQISVHQPFGGVVPEIAARDHIQKILPLISAAMTKCGVKGDELSGIAFTAGPGLVGALMVGASVGRSLAYAWGIPAIPVHHMEAHLMAVMLEEKRPDYPFLALLVSGGHTLLVEVTKFGGYSILGQSIDDAVGEAFDKTAKLLGLPYPGGPSLEKAAVNGVAGKFKFPRPMSNRPGFNMSFSGLKTSVANTVAKIRPLTPRLVADVAYAFQEAAIDSLIIKIRGALDHTGLNELAIVGGVSANGVLRQCCEELMNDRGGAVYYPRLEWCTDNGAMVAYTGYLRLRQQPSSLSDLAIKVKTRWPIDSIE